MHGAMPLEAGRAVCARHDAEVHPPRRRGGLGDAGGLGVNGELPAAVPRHIATDEELAAELGEVTVGLSAAAEWTTRVDALLRLEGLVLGSAAQRPALPDLLLPLRDALAAQLQERRSAVSRQACHAVGLLAAATGDRFEPLALALLPALLRALAMGIQVVCEAADACARAIIRHCHSAKLLPRLCATAAGDKSGRLRQSAAELLMQVLEDWPPAAYERQVQELERAILAAVRDAQGETRAVGRTMYAAYARACPGPASALLLSLEKDKALQEKLAAAMRSYVPSAVAAGGASQPLSRAGSAAGSEQGSHCAAAVASLPRTGSGLSMGALRPPPPVPRLVLPPSSSGSSPSSCGASARGVASLPLWQQQRESENLPDNRHELAAAAAKPPIGRSAAASRRSMGGAALRVSLAQARDEMAQEEGTAAATAGASAAAAALGGRAGPRRVSVNPGALRVVRPMPPFPSAPPSAVGSMSSLVDRLPSARSTSASLDRQASFAESEASAPSSYHAVYDELPAAPSLSQLLAGANRAGIGWSDRVDVFVALEAAVQGAGPAAAADVASNAERLVAALLDGAGDAHFKVAGAALQALGAGLAGPSSRVFEPHLDRIVPALFARVCDGKEQVRVLAAAALAALPSRHAPDAVVTALAKALAAVKAPRLRCAVMDHFSSAAGDPALRQLLCAQGSGLRALVAGAVQLARDKNPDIRRSALRLLATAYKAADADVVVAALGGLPQTAAEALHKPLLAAIEVLDLSALEAGQGQQQQQQQGEDEGPARAGTKDRTAAASAAAASMTERTEAQHSRAGAAAADASSSPAGGALEPATAATSAPAASEMPAQTPPPPSPFVWTAGPASLAATSAALKPERRPQSEQPPIPVPPGQQQQQQQPAPPLDAVMEGQLRRLLGQLQSGPRAFEVLQGLSRLVPALPASAWAAHFNQILAAAFVGLDSGSGPLEEAAALLVRDLAAALPPALFEPATPALLPRLLACAARAEAREVAVAADEALDALLRRVDPEPCLALLAPRLPAESVPQPTEASLMEPQRAAVRSLRRVLLRLPPPAVVARLDSLVPSLRAAYGSQFTEMRKAVVDCLVAVCLAVGKAAAEPHLAPLSASQRRLLDVYVQRAADAGRHTETP